MSRTVLITGPIGGGKSEVCRYLASRGFPVYDTDSRTKALYKNVPGLLERLENELGVPYSDFDIIFSDKGKRDRIENIVYPLVYDDIVSWKASLQNCGTLFIESAVAGERPLFRPLYDELWLVSAPMELRMARNPKVKERDAAQGFGHSPADRIIENDGTIEDLHKKIEKFL